jgi:predicted ATP-dependent protease
MPEANLASLGDLDEQTLKAVTIHPVSTVSEALAIALEPRA